MNTLPLHTPIEGFAVRDNCLCVGGRKITEVVALAGGTPLYVYDSSMIKQRVAKLRSIIPRDVKIHYAIKANPNKEIVSLLSRLVDGLDVASGGELDMALATKTPREEISFAGPGKRPREIEAAIAAGVVLNIESETELKRARDASQDWVVERE